MEAIQHSLLGSFVVTLFGSSGFLTWHTLAPLVPDRFAGAFALGTFGVLILFPFGAWILGYLARPAYRTFSPRGELQPEPPNGFDVWRRLPAGGLRPPRFMRWLVTAAGQSPDRRPSWLTLVLLLANLALLLALHFLGDERWSTAHPWLGSSDHRDLASLLPLAIINVVMVRVWATDQRSKLAPLED
ncbi:MAG: hypothetical protein EON96_13795 [Caulobacteraceae bacterium]|nr:MAG: hypothetical protein EON96_13795 [Caulobacteraceae bacterium]